MMPLSVAAVICRTKKILLAKRIAGGSLSECWEFPGGKVEAGETAAEALQRELYEELGITAAVGDCIASGGFVHKGIERRLEAYLVECNSEDLKQLKLHEHSAARWVPCNEIASYDLADSDRSILSQVLSALDCVGEESDL